MYDRYIIYLKGEWPMYVHINGSFVSEAEARISVFDHGFLYGDGVFEGIRAYNGRIFCLDEHIDRLFESAESKR
jgi:branched-chain amino acid aminotransferase